MFKEKVSWAASRVRVITPSEYCEQLSIASINDLKKLFPESFDIEGNPDLLLNAFNAAVANRINANDDGIGTDTALEISKRFIHKFTNIEHDRDSIVGHIISQGFSQFGSNEVVGSEALASTDKAFNIALGAVVYKTVNPAFAGMLVESSDETSPRYNQISASWELGFNKYKILLGHRDVSEGELITDEAQIKEFAKNLRCYGGSGMTKDSVPVYRLIVGGLPLGIGYTTNPAADVEGVIVKTEATQVEAKKEEPEVIIVHTTEEEKGIAASNEFRSALFELAKEYAVSFEDLFSAAQKISKSSLTCELGRVVSELPLGDVVEKTKSALILSKSSGLSLSDSVAQLTAAITAFKKVQKSAKTFSQTTNPPVKKDSNMELKSLSDITDDNLKQFSAANVTAFIASEILKSNEVYKQQVADKEKESSDLASKVTAFEKLVNDSAEALKKTNEELEKVKIAQAKEVADREFNERMQAIAEKYDLDEKLIAVIAKEIAGLNDEQFKAAFEKYELLLSSKLRKTETTVASTTSTTVETVLEGVKKDDKGNVIATGAQAGEKSKYDEFKDAFHGEGAITITRR